MKLGSYLIRIVDLDYYMSIPIQGLDVTYSEFRGSSVSKVPVLRIFGSTATGKKICVHIHGVFPYIYIPYDGTQEVHSLMYQVAANIDKTLNICLNQASSTTQHVYKICLVSGIPMYGYHKKEHQFLKIYLYNPVLIRKTNHMLMNEATLGKFYQPHEAHLNFTLQFMIDYNLHGMSNIILSEMKFRRDPVNTDTEVDAELLLPDTISKMSVCEQEGDALAEHIVNRHEVSSGNIAINPGIAALWADEMQRRRNKGEISQIPHFLELENTNIEPTKSHYVYKTALLDRLAVISPDINIPEKLNMSVYPALTPQGVSIQNASFVDTQIPSSLDLSLNDTTLTSTDILNESVGQTINLSLTLDAEAQNLLEILEILEEDSILSQHVNEDEDDKDMDLSMPLESITTPKKIVINKDDASDEEELWNEFNTTFIPQLDGECDNEEQMSIEDNLPNQPGAKLVNIDNIKQRLTMPTCKGRSMPLLDVDLACTEHFFGENNNLKTHIPLPRNTNDKYYNTHNTNLEKIHIRSNSKTPKGKPTGKDFPKPYEDSDVPNQSGAKLLNTDRIKQRLTMLNCKGRSMPIGVNNNIKTHIPVPIKTNDEKYKTQNTNSYKIDLQNNSKIPKDKPTTSKDFPKYEDSEFKIPKRKYVRKSPHVKTLEAIRSLGYQIRRDVRRNQIFRTARKLHQKERDICLLLSRSSKPKFRVTSKIKIHSQYVKKVKHQNFTDNPIIRDIVLRIRKHIDPDLYLTVEYPSGKCLVYNYNKSVYPNIFEVPKPYVTTGNEKLLKSYIDQIRINYSVSAEDISKSIDRLTLSEVSFPTNYALPVCKNEDLPDFWQKFVYENSSNLEDMLVQSYYKDNVINNNHSMDENDNTLSKVEARLPHNKYLSRNKNLKEFIDADNKENIYIFSSKYIIDVNDNNLVDNIINQSHKQLKESAKKVMEQLQLHITYLNKPIYQSNSSNNKEISQTTLRISNNNAPDESKMCAPSSAKCCKSNLSSKISISKIENYVTPNAIRNYPLRNRKYVIYKNTIGEDMGLVSGANKNVYVNKNGVNSKYGIKIKIESNTTNCLPKGKIRSYEDINTTPRNNALPYNQSNEKLPKTGTQEKINSSAKNKLLLNSNIAMKEEVNGRKRSQISNFTIGGDMCSLSQTNITMNEKVIRRKKKPFSNSPVGNVGSSKNKPLEQSNIAIIEKVNRPKKLPISNITDILLGGICCSKTKDLLQSSSVIKEKMKRSKKTSKSAVERDKGRENAPISNLSEKVNQKKRTPISSLAIKGSMGSSKNKPLEQSNVIIEKVSKRKKNPISNLSVEKDVLHSNSAIKVKVKRMKNKSISKSAGRRDICSSNGIDLLHSNIMIKKKVNRRKKSSIPNSAAEGKISFKNKPLPIIDISNRKKRTSVSNSSVGRDIYPSENKVLVHSNIVIKEETNGRKKSLKSKSSVELNSSATILRRSARNQESKIYLANKACNTCIFLDGTHDSTSSSEDDSNTNRQKRKSSLGSHPYSALPISIVGSSESSRSLNKSSADKHLVTLNTNKNYKKEKVSISQLVQQADCDINVKRRLSFGNNSSLQTTIVEEELCCIYSPSSKFKSIMNNKNNSKAAIDVETDFSHHVNRIKSDNIRYSSSITEASGKHKNEYTLLSKSSVDITRAETSDNDISGSENEINSSFFNSPQIVRELNSVMTAAERYDKETNYNAKEGTSKVFTPQAEEMSSTDSHSSSEELQHSTGSSSFGLLTPYQRIKNDVNLSTIVEGTEVTVSPVSPHMFSSSNSENKYSLPVQESVIKTEICDILNLRNITVCPIKNAPSKENVLNSLANYNISHVMEDKPFYSNVDDVTGNVEVGYNVLKINSKTTAHLSEFESQFDSMKNFRKFLVDRNYPNLQWKTSHVNKLKINSCIDRNCILKPIKNPPTVDMVKGWIKERSRKPITPEKRTVKTKIIIPCSPNNENDFEASSLTISPCTPSSTKNEAVNIVQQTPASSKTSMHLDVETITRTKLLTQSYTPSLRKSLLRSLDSSNENQSSQITGVTINNTYGFNNTTENLQEARAVIEHQQLTLLVMELHITTRGDFKPNPTCDPIRAIFYSILNDVAENHPKASKCKGVIAVNNLAFTSTNSKVPILDGAGVDCHITYVDSEENLIKEFLNLIHYWDPDILAGYEIQMLSWGYLIERSFILGINFKELLGRTREKLTRSKDEDGQNELKIVGRIVLDVWRLMRHEIALQSYTFESIVYHILHKRVPRYSFKELTFWWDHRSSLHRHRTVQYYLFRVESILELFDKLDIIARTSELARLFGILFYEVLSRGSQFRVESMMLRLAKPLNYIPVSPDKHQRAQMKAPEYIALVLEPESKLYNDPVIVLDFQSLYPSIIIAYNYCFTTCVGRVECLGKNIPFEFGVSQLKVARKELDKLLRKGLLNFSPCGVGFVKKKVRDGILPRMLREILDTRLMVKNSMKENGADGILQKVLHNRQLGLKLIANVTYGYTAANFSGRMPCVEIADSVFSKGRETLQRAIEMVDTTAEWGARVVYGDTDSLFVLVPGRSREHAFKIGKQIAEAVTRANPDPIKLKMEKVYQPCILQTKKHYVGFMYESVDQKEPVYDAKGIETVRRDGCPAVAKMLEKCLRILFDTKDVTLVKKYVLRQFNKILAGRASIQDLTFAKEYRGVDGYRPGACVPSLELARKWKAVDIRNEPRSGERVPYIIVNGPPGLPLIRLVRSPTDLLNDSSLRPNALYYITRVIIPPINRCFKLIGADLQTWFNQMPRKQQTQYLPNSISPTKKSTISQYFSTISCVACGDQTQNGICDKCTNEPQVTTVTVMEKLRSWEKNYYNCDLICQSCTSAQIDIKCISLDCPVLYRRLQTNRDLQQAPYVRQLLSSMEFLF